MTNSGSAQAPQPATTTTKTLSSLNEHRSTDGARREKMRHNHVSSRFFGLDFVYFFISALLYAF